jgi:hypothetical protein
MTERWKPPKDPDSLRGRYYGFLIWVRKHRANDRHLLEAALGVGWRHNEHIGYTECLLCYTEAGSAHEIGCPLGP